MTIELSKEARKQANFFAQRQPAALSLSASCCATTA